jgi:CDP-glycerol glycerophosphotransferase (TagB/SpsB family)
VSRLEFALASAVLRLIGRLFSALPMNRRRVVLASPRTARLDGNLRYLARAIRDHYPDRRLVVLVQPYGYGWRAKVAYFVHAIRGLYYLQTSPLVFVDNAWLPVHVAPHRIDTTVVQLWHAVSAVKRFGLDTARPPDEPERTFLHRFYDFVIVSADAVRPTYAAALRTPIERVLALGTPRTDFFFDPAAMDAARRRLLRAYPTLAGRRVVLIAPTLRGRGRGKTSTAGIDPERLRALLPESFALVLKPHPNVDPSSMPKGGYDVILDQIDEINDALALADVLVTDYSSSIFEFALLRRPIVVLAGDLDAYARDPGVVLDFTTDMVGTQVDDTIGVAAALLDDRFDMSGYDAFIERHVGACDGQSSNRVATCFLGQSGVSTTSSDV